MENKSGIHPVGHRILIRPFEIEKMTKSGIILCTENQAVREEMAQTQGVVIAIGDGCYLEEPEPWCKVGDKVIFAKYAGILQEGLDGNKYRIMNDTDVVAVIE
jgi:chaperonin GroES